jgi:hypothetical protein
VAPFFVQSLAFVRSGYLPIPPKTTNALTKPTTNTKSRLYYSRVESVYYTILYCTMARTVPLRQQGLAAVVSADAADGGALMLVKLDKVDEKTVLVLDVDDPDAIPMRKSK